MQRSYKDETISTEAQWGIKALNSFDYAFELTDTKRFVPGDPLPRLLQSLRGADSAGGNIVDVGLWNMFQRRCIKPNNTGTYMSDARLPENPFQAIYCVSYYWQAVVLFCFARDRREARLLCVTLLWIQAADDIHGVSAQTRGVRAKTIESAAASLEHSRHCTSEHVASIIPWSTCSLG